MSKRDGERDEELFASIAKENNWQIPKNSSTIGQRFLVGEPVSSATAPMGSQVQIQSSDMQDMFMPSFGSSRVAPSLQQHSNSEYFDPKKIPINQDFRKAVTLGNLDASIQPIPKELLFSASGFDIVTALVKMSTRPNPKIQLGPVDLNCSFLVADLNLPDMPIIYVSPTFEELTGYPHEEILGRNCRFLQDPNGTVFPGTTRLFTDHSVVQRMKQCVDERSEGQFTLVNYRKTGEPFLNYLTMIPICMSNDEKSKKPTHYVGLQVDLITQPKAIMKRLQNGTYSVNYQYDSKRLTAEPEEPKEPEDNFEPAAVETTYARVPEVLNNVMDDFPDFVFFLSLRGLFLNVAETSALNLTGFSSEELIGHKLSEFVHPSDMVAVMRDFKSCSAVGSVNIICRMKRKDSGFFYADLSSHVYSGSKRNRCFIVAAREFFVPDISLTYFSQPERISSNETWIKLSLEGLILYGTQSCVHFFDIRKDSINNHSLFDFLNHACKKVLQSTLDGERSCSVNITIQTDKNSFECLLTLAAVSDSARKYYWVQIKKNHKSLTRCAEHSLFGMIKGTMSSSIYYECNKLRVTTSRIQEEISSIRSK